MSFACLSDRGASFSVAAGVPREVEGGILPPGPSPELCRSPVLQRLTRRAGYLFSAQGVAQRFCLCTPNAFGAGRRVALGCLPNAVGVRHNPAIHTQATASRLQVCDTAELELCATLSTYRARRLPLCAKEDRPSWTAAAPKWLHASSLERGHQGWLLRPATGRGPPQARPAAARPRAVLRHGVWGNITLIFILPTLCSTQ
jgi:hypothetical protein